VNRLRAWANEHPAVCALALALLAALVTMGSLHSYERRLRAKVRERRALLDRSESLAREYAQLQARLRALADRLAEAAAFDASAVLKIAEEHGLRERVREPKSRSGQVNEQGLIERTVTLSILGLTRKKLARFLLDVEERTRSAITRTLVITPSKGGGGLVDAQVTFSAHESTTTRSQ